MEVRNDDRSPAQCKIYTRVVGDAVVRKEKRVNLVRVDIDEKKCAELVGRYQVLLQEMIRN